MLIGITGEMGSGKSTVAEMILRCAEGHIIPFAQPLKDLARSIGWDGNKDKKGRRLLQLLGTDVLRECIDPYWHTKKWREAIGITLSKYCDPMTPIIIADDLRFLNEESTILGSGGKIIRIVGRRHGVVKTSFDDFKDHFKRKHRSESEFLKIKHDYSINNDCTRLELAVRLNTIMRMIQG